MEPNQCIRKCPNPAKIEHCRSLLAGLNDPLTQRASIFDLAGNPTRLKILYLLYGEHALCVCDLSDILGITISAVSQHLRKLKDGGLLLDRREGQTIFYSVTPATKDFLNLAFHQINVNQPVAL